MDGQDTFDIMQAIYFILFCSQLLDVENDDILKTEQERPKERPHLTVILLYSQASTS
jgi:hypothetical protein